MFNNVAFRSLQQDSLGEAIVVGVCIDSAGASWLIAYSSS